MPLIWINMRPGSCCISCCIVLFLHEKHINRTQFVLHICNKKSSKYKGFKKMLYLLDFMRYSLNRFESRLALFLMDQKGNLK